MEYSAQHYLNQWLANEQDLRHRLMSKDSTEVRVALSDAVKFFQVARNLPRKFDVGQGQERYEPLLREFRKLTEASIAADNYVDMVDQFQHSIGAHYGGRNLISLSSKLLWLRYRDPFIIYDSRVRNALGVTSEDYGEFSRRWLEEFENYKSGIAAACESLLGVLDYFAPKTADVKEDVAAISSKEWFHRRVFDIYLWHEGG